MTTYLEIHALQALPPANLNRDDTGAPKTATYGGVQRARVSSQSWKRAMREDFNRRVAPSQVGVRSTQVVQLVADAIVASSPELADQAQTLAAAAMGAIGIKVVAPKRKGAEQKAAESSYLIFLSRAQVENLAAAAIEAAESEDPAAALKAAKLKAIVDRDHSIDIALFGRMVAEQADLNVDASCQVAHAIGVHEVTPEFDYFTAVDDVKDVEEETGAGMIGTVEFNASTFYRYAVVNVDQLHRNLGAGDATRLALQEFVRSFIESVPSGKQNTFAHGTRPDAVMVVLGGGTPVNLVGAFENPIVSAGGYMEQAVERLAGRAQDVFSTWRRPDSILVCGLPGETAPLMAIEGAEQVGLEDLVARSADLALVGKEAQ